MPCNNEMGKSKRKMTEENGTIWVISLKMAQEGF